MLGRNSAGVGMETRDVHHHDGLHTAVEQAFVTREAAEAATLWRESTCQTLGQSSPSKPQTGGASTALRQPPPEPTAT